MKSAIILALVLSIVLSITTIPLKEVLKSPKENLLEEYG